MAFCPFQLLIHSSLCISALAVSLMRIDNRSGNYLIVFRYSLLWGLCVCVCVSPFTVMTHHSKKVKKKILHWYKAESHQTQAQALRPSKSLTSSLNKCLFRLNSLSTNAVKSAPRSWQDSNSQQALHPQTTSEAAFVSAVTFSVLWICSFLSFSLLSFNSRQVRVRRGEERRKRCWVLKTSCRERLFMLRSQ